MVACRILDQAGAVQIAADQVRAVEPCFAEGVEPGRAARLTLSQEPIGALRRALTSSYNDLAGILPDLCGQGSSGEAMDRCMQVNTGASRPAGMHLSRICYERPDEDTVAP
jgi:hypothetical protein